MLQKASKKRHPKDPTVFFRVDGFHPQRESITHVVDRRPPSTDTSSVPASLPVPPLLVSFPPPPRLSSFLVSHHTTTAILYLCIVCLSVCVCLCVCVCVCLQLFPSSLPLSYTHRHTLITFPLLSCCSLSLSLYSYLSLSLSLLLLSVNFFVNCECLNLLSVPLIPPSSVCCVDPCVLALVVSVCIGGVFVECLAHWLACLCTLTILLIPQT